MLIILYLLFSMHVVISHYEYMHVSEYYIIFAMLMSYLPVFANRGSGRLLCFVDGGGSCIH